MSEINDCLGKVEISQSGRGGSIYYRETDNTATFDWEFAMPPALVLVFAPKSSEWDRRYDWARGRQQEIFAFVAAEVVRQKAEGSGIDIDLESGTISILMPKRQKRDSSVRRSSAGKAKTSAPPKENAPVAKAPASADEALELELESLGKVDTPQARAQIDEASRHYLSTDTRLIAAAIMHRQGRLPDIEGFLAKEIRNLDRVANGLARALRLAELHPGIEVKQALLYASWNSTECAPHCAKLLLRLTTSNQEPLETKLQDILQKLDLHNSYFDRKAAFDQLCEVVGMSL